MTDKRKLFWGFTAFIFGIDVAIHFYGELHKILTVINAPSVWPDYFYWLVGAVIVLAWNTFIGAVGTILSPIGIVVLVILIGGYFETRPLRPTKS
jgi:hypothetical protein